MSSNVGDEVQLFEVDGTSLAVVAAWRGAVCLRDRCPLDCLTLHVVVARHIFGCEVKDTYFPQASGFLICRCCLGQL